MIDIEKYRNNGGNGNNANSNNQSGNDASSNNQSGANANRTNADIRQAAAYFARMSDPTSQEYIQSADEPGLLRTADKLINEGCMSDEDAITYMTNRGANPQSAARAVQAIAEITRREKEKEAYSTRWPWFVLAFLLLLAFNDCTSYAIPVLALAAALFILFKLWPYRKTTKFRYVGTALGTVLALIVGFVGFHNTEYWQEKKAYNEAKESFNYRSYVTAFPKGKHINEIVGYIAEGNSYNLDTLKVYVPYITDNDFKEEVIFTATQKLKTATAYCFYMGQCFEGKNYNKIHSDYLAMWDAEIAKYNARDTSGEDPKATAFVNEMLQYMKAHYVHEISINFRPNVNLREYDEYPQYVKDLYNFSNVHSYKEKYEDGSTDRELQDIITSAFASNFESIFSPGFISITRTAQADAPCLNVTYDIHNEEIMYEGKSYPDVWSDNRFGFSSIYLIGISVNVKATFSIPGSESTYTYSNNGKTDETIQAYDWSDAYTTMVRRCFQNFADKLNILLRIS